jgi:hypothetical protein
MCAIRWERGRLDRIEHCTLNKVKRNANIIENHELT